MEVMRKTSGGHPQLPLGRALLMLMSAPAVNLQSMETSAAGQQALDSLRGRIECGGAVAADVVAVLLQKQADRTATDRKKASRAEAALLWLLLTTSTDTRKAIEALLKERPDAESLFVRAMGHSTERQWRALEMLRKSAYGVSLGTIRATRALVHALESLAAAYSLSASKKRSESAVRVIRLASAVMQNSSVSLRDHCEETFERCLPMVSASVDPWSSRFPHVITALKEEVGLTLHRVKEERSAQKGITNTTGFDLSGDNGCGLIQEVVEEREWSASLCRLSSTLSSLLPLLIVSNKVATFSQVEEIWCHSLEKISSAPLEVAVLLRLSRNVRYQHNSSDLSLVRNSLLEWMKKNTTTTFDWPISAAVALARALVAFSACYGDPLLVCGSNADRSAAVAAGIVKERPLELFDTAIATQHHHFAQELLHSSFRDPPTAHPLSRQLELIFLIEKVSTYLLLPDLDDQLYMAFYAAISRWKDGPLTLRVTSVARLAGIAKSDSLRDALIDTLRTLCQGATRKVAVTALLDTLLAERSQLPNHPGSLDMANLEPAQAENAFDTLQRVLGHSLCTEAAMALLEEMYAHPQEQLLVQLASRLSLSLSKVAGAVCDFAATRMEEQDRLSTSDDQPLSVFTALSPLLMLRVIAQAQYEESAPHTNVTACLVSRMEGDGYPRQVRKLAAEAFARLPWECTVSIYTSRLAELLHTSGEALECSQSDATVETAKVLLFSLCSCAILRRAQGVRLTSCRELLDTLSHALRVPIGELSLRMALIETLAVCSLAVLSTDALETSAVLSSQLSHSDTAITPLFFAALGRHVNEGDAALLSMAPCAEVLTAAASRDDVKAFTTIIREKLNADS